MNMCIVVTNSGAGNPKCLVENIHLLYTDKSRAKKNLKLSETLLQIECSNNITHHEAINMVLMKAFLHHSRFFSAKDAKCMAAPSARPIWSS